MVNSGTRLARGNQNGYVFLMVLLVLVVGGATFFSGGYTSLRDDSIHGTNRPSLTLENAASALQIYSMTDEDRPGSLPCPDFTGDGTTDINCLSTPDAIYVKRLPWRTLDIGREADSLWYVMDSDFRDHPYAQPINAELEGSLVIQDAAGVDITGFVALIIDPGDPLEGQDHRGSAGEEVGDYLDIAENVDGDRRFIDCASREDCNDRVIGISADELFSLVQRRVADAMKEPIEAFVDDAFSGQGHLPYAAKLNSSTCEPGVARGQLPLGKGDCSSSVFIDADEFPSWLTDNDWLDLAIYHVDESCAGTPCNAGDLKVDGEGDFTLVIALSGASLPGQDRTDEEVNIDDYLESGIDDGVYVNQTKAAANNDVYWGLRQ